MKKILKRIIAPWRLRWAPSLEQQLKAREQAILQAGSDEEALLRFSELLAERQSTRDAYNNRINKTYYKLLRISKGKSNELKSTIANWSTVSDVPYILVRNAARYGRLNQLASFRELMVLRMKQKMLLGKDATPEWKVNPKTDAYRFVDKHAVRRPEASLKRLKLASLPVLDNVVVKPAFGESSNGVFIIPKGRDILEVANLKRYASRDDMLARMKSLIATDAVRKDAWLVEELVGGADYERNLDVKFFCFYGEIGLIRVIQRVPEKVDVWFTENGEPVDSGNYMHKDQRASIPLLIKAHLEAVRKLSLAIPAPFMRIDYILTESGELVFGEFTPQPGSFAKFNRETDRMLGDYYLKAQAKLMQAAVKDFP